MAHYHIRFNTKNSGDPRSMWRVFEDGEEYLVSGFEIHVRMYDEVTEEHGTTKYNVACDGEMRIIDGRAIIRDESVWTFNDGVQAVKTTGAALSDTIKRVSAELKERYKVKK